MVAGISDGAVGLVCGCIARSSGIDVTALCASGAQQ